MSEKPTVKGIEYLTDDQGNRIAAVIDLKKWGKLWEDFLDILVSESRNDEETVEWEKFKLDLKR